MSVEHYTSTGVTFAELPEIRRARGDGLDGYLYIIEFSTGTLKAGRSNNPRGRIKSHLDDARKFGATITRLWLSAPHSGYKENEALLLEQLGDPSYGAEYFTSTGFDDAVTIAESSLVFNVLTDSEREALKAEEKRRGEEKITAFKKWTGGPDLVRISLDPTIDAWAANLLFGHFRTLPEISADSDPANTRKALEILSTTTGLDVAEIGEWSFLDLIEFMGQQQLTIGIAKLKMLAYETDRMDLVSPGFYLDDAVGGEA